ncbi:MAG: motif family protein [Thermoanaerobaculia bacterium]|jgi:Spy/CpxP family protein refolding chaperone|nr:motif family protein [Thermoanaerobaculia bacterium]
MKRIVIALMVAATSAVAFAQTPGAGNFHRHGHRGGLRQLAALNLTDAQKQQMKDIRSSDRQSNQQLYADFRAKLQQFRALKRANDPGADAAKAQIESMKPQVEAAHKTTRHAMLEVLTPDQRAQLKEARQSRGFGDNQGARSFGRHEGRGLRQAAATKLNLTDEQKSQLRQLRETNQAKNQQLFADARAKRQELRALTRANDPKASDVKAQLDALRPQLKAAREEQHTAFLNILTPEQRTQLEQWKSQREQRLR